MAIGRTSLSRLCTDIRALALVCHPRWAWGWICHTTHIFFGTLPNPKCSGRTLPRVDALRMHEGLISMQRLDEPFATSLNFKLKANVRHRSHCLHWDLSPRDDLKQPERFLFSSQCPNESYDQRQIPNRSCRRRVGRRVASQTSTKQGVRGSDPLFPRR
jgi:hypothetical protein